MSATSTEQTVYRRADMFAAFVAVMRSGDVIEIDAEMFRFWLNVLPTKGEHMTVKVGGVSRRVDFLQAEGAEELRAFWIEGSGEGARYFCQRTDIMNPYA